MSIFQGKYISIMGFLAGVFFIVSYFFGDQFLTHPPKKSDLSVAFGEIEWVVRASKSGRDVRFKFRNGGAYVYHGYGNTLAKELYDSLLLKGVVVEVLVDFSEVQKPWFNEFHYSPVYEIHVNGKVIRSYEEKMASIDRGTSIMLWFGMFLIFISVYEYRKYRKQYRSKT